MMAEDSDYLSPLVHEVIQEFLEAEIAEAVGTERESSLKGDSAYQRELPADFIARVGKLVLRVPQDRSGSSLPSILALSAQRAGAGSGVNGGVRSGGIHSEVTAISEELSVLRFSASAISGFKKKLLEELERFARLELDFYYPF